MPQLQINAGPQDALLYDNTRSYFTNVGYVRTSNFQMELRDVDPQNSATLGSTVQFVIPKAADLLGPVDLMVGFTKNDNDLHAALGDGASAFAGWVESLGYALIDKIVFSVGSHDVETISGDQLYITNELMRGDEHRFAKSHILKTGRPLVRTDCSSPGGVVATYTASAAASAASSGSPAITVTDFQGALAATGDKVYRGTTLIGTADAASTDAALNLETIEVAVAVGDVLTVRRDLWDPIFDASESSNSGRLISAQYDTSDGQNNDDTTTPKGDIKVHYDGKKLIIPLGLFFTKHPSQYFPLAAIAGSNDVRIQVKLRTLNELLVIKTSQTVAGGSVTVADPIGSISTPKVQLATGECKLRCHYVHVTGPEASLLMNKEHVRLMKLWQNHNVTQSLTDTAAKDNTVLFDFELPFLHPVQELIIVIRKTSEMSSSTDPVATTKDLDKKARTKNYFAFHGAGKDPNIESQRYCTHEAASMDVESHLEVQNFKLTLNGQERHPSLASHGIDRKYLKERIMPMLHTNTSCNFNTVAEQSYYRSTKSNAGPDTTAPFHSDDLKALAEMLDCKEIYVYPFSLNPEGANPSGAVNFSKVSHAKLRIEGKVVNKVENSSGVMATNALPEEYRCDVWGVHFNWLQIKDGRALTSFA